MSSQCDASYVYIVKHGVLLVRMSVASSALCCSAQVCDDFRRVTDVSTLHARQLSHRPAALRRSVSQSTLSLPVHSPLSYNYCDTSWILTTCFWQFGYSFICESTLWSQNATLFFLDWLRPILIILVQGIQRKFHARSYNDVHHICKM